MNSENALNTIETLREYCVRQLSDNGRARVLAHSDLVDVTRRPQPRGVTCERLSDLVEWLGQYGKESASSVYFSSGNGAKVTAFLEEVWREDYATFHLSLSRAVKRWLGDPMQAGSRRFTQEELIRHLEAWEEELRLPASVAPVLQTLRALSLSATVKYNRKFEDENNVRLEFQIEENAPAQAATLPKLWELSLPIFEGSESLTIPATLRYQIPTGENSAKAPVVFSFDAPRFPAIYEAAVEGLETELAEQLGGKFPIFRGDPFKK